MTTLRIPILLLLLGLLSGPVGAAKNGQSELELRQPNTTNNNISAQVGETVQVEVFIRGRGEQITGVQLFFSFDDTFLELVPVGPVGQWAAALYTRWIHQRHGLPERLHG